MFIIDKKRSKNIGLVKINKKFYLANNKSSRNLVKLQLEFHKNTNKSHSTAEIQVHYITQQELLSLSFNAENDGK